MTALLLIVLLVPYPPCPPEPPPAPALQQAGAWEEYYQPTPPLARGFATRYGSDSLSEWELWRFAQAAAHQAALFGVPAEGGWYGIEQRGRFVEDAGDAWVLHDAALPVLPQQQTLLSLAALEDREFFAAVGANYAGVMSLRSPNDLGRTYCLYGQEGQLIGPVLVGGHAARHDWVAPGLGALRWADERWLADLPDALYYAAGGEGGPVSITIYEPGRALVELIN